MGKEWDGSKVAFDVAVWSAIYDAMLPGSHLLSFGGDRTIHRMITAIEDAGFDIRTQLAWIFGSGFPKSHNLSGEWEGWGTALKPAMELICLARKPLTGTVAQNVLTHGTGALNIDGCRIAAPDDRKPVTGFANRNLLKRNAQANDRPWMLAADPDESGAVQPHPAGRWPANVLLDEHAAALLDEQSGTSKSTGGASRFFYVAKASRAERNRGLPEGSVCSHPTVKPLALMRWLLTLVTPPGGIVLDPFVGSGSTLVACAQLGIPAYGIDMNEEYIEIAARRIDHALNERAREEAKPRQLMIAD